ncbi:hypothetical protein BBK82_04985 [Lentzea guizhouensis]|uniref:Phage tail protein n=2 Tax=Lentzea guizhouensis TaxID=1586287 RepID=A0A1B2HXS5_9PSEU|nr:hypothetical protein BBK82_04985 [Lentzea guizhouensis]
MSTLLSRDEILSAVDITTEDVDVPEWGGRVRVRGLTGTDRDRFESAMLNRNGKGNARHQVNTDNFRARLVMASVVDEDGRRMFSERDVRALGEKSAAALDRVMTVAMRLSGLTQKDADELEGN